MNSPNGGSGLFVGDSLPGLLFREGVVIAAMSRDEGPLCVASDMAEPWNVRVVHACGAAGGGPVRSTRQAGGRESATGLHSAAVTATEFRNWGDRERFDCEIACRTIVIDNYHTLLLRNQGAAELVPVLGVVSDPDARSAFISEPFECLDASPSDVGVPVVGVWDFPIESLP